MLLRIDAIGALASLGLEGLDLVTRPFQRAGHEPANRVPLPSHLLHNLGNRSAILALKHRDHLSRLTARARRASFRFGWFRSLSAFGRLLGRGGLLSRLTLGGRALAALCATLGLPFRFRRRAYRLLGFGHALNPAPDFAGSGLGVLESLGWRHARQAVPDGKQALRGPTSNQLRQFLRSGKGLRARSDYGLGLVRTVNAVMLLSVSIVNVVMALSP